MEEHIMRNTSAYREGPPKALRIAGWIVGGIALAVFLAFIFGYFVMLLWNWIMPSLFGLPLIDYWMAFGIIILARLIFGGLGSGHKDEKHKSSHHKRYFGSKFKRKFNPRDCSGSKWNQYEDFWEEEGEAAFRNYLRRKQDEPDTLEIKTDGNEETGSKD